MDKGVLLGKLLDEYTNLSNYFMIFGDEFIVANQGCTAKEWTDGVEEFLATSNKLIEDYSKFDNEFCVFQYRVAEEADEQYSRMNYASGDISRRSKSGNCIHKENDDSVPPLEEPFAGYFKLNRKLNENFILLEWLSEKYDVITPGEVSRMKKQGKFGGFKFDLDTSGTPISVSFDGRRLNITGLRLIFFFMVLDGCYYTGEEISIDEIMDKMDQPESEVRKYQSEVNKALRRQLGDGNYIHASRGGKKRCIRVDF